MNTNTKKYVTIAMLSALAYVVMCVARVPMVLFLKYDPKDIIIAIGGFMYGPLAALIMSLAVSFVEMITVSSTGPIGFLMNAISTCAFACTAAYIYQKRHSLKGAIMGLVVGTFTMTAIMLLWNYIITPIYMGLARETIVKMLLPTFLPFNLVKGGLNTAFTLLLYKPLSTILRSNTIIPQKRQSQKPYFSWGVLLTAIFFLGTSLLCIWLLWYKK